MCCVYKLKLIPKRCMYLCVDNTTPWHTTEIFRYDPRVVVSFWLVKLVLFGSDWFLTGRSPESFLWFMWCGWFLTCTYTCVCRHARSHLVGHLTNLLVVRVSRALCLTRASSHIRMCVPTCPRHTRVPDKTRLVGSLNALCSAWPRLT